MAGKTSAPPDPVQHLTVSIHDLVPHEDNYNQHPQDQLEGLKDSLRTFGQVEDTVVKRLAADGKYKIVAHEGVTTAALQLLQAGECPHLAQWNITVVPDSWDAIKIKGYLLASNLHAQRSIPDDAKLANLLQEQLDAGQRLEAIGSDEETLRQLLEAEANKLLEENEGRTTELKEPEGGEITETHGVLISCANEAEQQRAYELATREGFTCRVLTL